MSSDVVSTVTLRDGRAVSYADLGVSDGAPLFYFHGAGTSRHEADVFDTAAADAGVRLIAPDRPGCGDSDPHPARTVVGYSADVAQLADALGINRFAVGGVSNGGMFAMAVAAAIPDRVTGAVPINPTTPTFDKSVRRALPPSARLAYAAMRRVPGLVVRMAMRATDVPGDYIREEIVLGARDWGFDHRSVPAPVEFFTGESDAGAHYASRWVASLPDARLHRFAGGHGDFGVSAAMTAIVAAFAKVAPR